MELQWGTSATHGRSGRRISPSRPYARIIESPDVSDNFRHVRLCGVNATNPKNMLKIEREAIPTHVRSRRNEKGAALLQSLFAVGMIGIFVGTALQHLQTQNRIHKFQQEKAMRTEIGTQLTTYLRNSEMLLFSAQFPADATSPGNAALLPCTALDGTVLATCSDIVFPPEGLEFLLVPPLSHSYPADKGKNQSANCPRPDARSDISCFLAGQKAGKQVGYNTQGFVGELGPDFPLEAKVFFRPYCPTQDTFGNPIPPPPEGQTCGLPKGIDVRFELIHHLFLGQTDTGKLGYLGKYPSKVQWNTLSASQLHGQTCNPGATIQGIDPNGLIECTCATPYHPTGTLNAKGPLCALELQTCPAGTLLKGRKADSTPICQTEEQKGDFQEWTTTITIASTATQPPGIADCNVRAGTTVGGWVKSYNQRCDTSYTVEQKKTSKFVWDIILGLGGGAAAAAVIILLVNPATTLAGLIIVGAVALGGFLSWLLGTSPTVIVLQEGEDPNDPNNGPDYIPSVRCEIVVGCRAFM